MRTIGRWIKRLVLVGIVAVLALIAMKDVQMIRTIYAAVMGQELSTEDVAGLLEDVDAAEVIEDLGGVISTVTGVDYEVVETESGSMIEIRAEELSDLAETVQNYVSEEDIEEIAAAYGISVDAIAAGDYSSLGLTGDETLQISEEELEYVLSIVQQYLDG